MNYITGLESLLNRELLVTNVPKGSGLGTSSILSAACVKAVFEFMGIAYTEEDLYPVNNTVKYIDKLRGHRRDGKLEHQSAYGCLAKICCCVHFNFPHPFDRDCRTCMCSSPCILIIVNFNRYGQKKL